MKLPAFVYSLDRFWLHVPVGWVIVGLVWLHWAAGLAYVALFLGYELDEAKYTHDQAWKDIAGAMAGMIMGGAFWKILDWRL